MGITERKLQEKEIKKKDIIDAAERVFFQKGYVNSSMDEVAKEAEFSKRTVYVYFSSKEEIYFEIMIRGYRLLLEMLDESFQKGGLQTAEEEFNNIFFTFFSFSEKHTHYFRAIMEYETQDSEAKTVISSTSKEECYRLGEQVLEYLVKAVEKGVLEGFLKSGLDSHKTALILWAFTIGVFNTTKIKCSYLENYHHISAKEFITESFHFIMKLMEVKE